MSTLRDKVLNLTNGNEIATEQILGILNLPDNLFEEVYPEVKSSLVEIYSRNDIQRKIIEIIEGIKEFDAETEIKNRDSLINEIMGIDELSEKKKDLLIEIAKAATNALLELVENPRERIPVKIKLLNDNAKIPKYANNSDAGADIYTIETITVEPGQTKIIPTGIKVDIPKGYMIQIYSRSGLAAKTKLRIANSVGIIDSSYNKEIGVIVDNIGEEPVTIKEGERIAQMLIMPTPMIKWIEVNEIEESSRGGFGSTGKS